VERHPGGAEATLRLIELAGIEPPCRMIDLGAGTGEAVRLLRSLGFEAVGIDLAPGPDVERGDILDPPFADGSFDAALSQCGFFLTGDPERALVQAARLLRPGGRLLYADVCAGGEAWLRRACAAAGFDIEEVTDITEAWKRYYIAALWQGEAELPLPGAKNCRYLSAILKKGGQQNGCI
jgi:ubiquinone/menaquinone biosynthesis C-methylase UbiE